jgi:predicted nucleic acid-binding protein
MALLPRIFLTSFQRVELIHAIYQHVFRGFISSDEAVTVTQAFENDCRSGLWVQVRQPERMYDAAVLLAKQHVATFGVRTLDSLHVASALELKATAFWTFDQRQARLAEAEGLQVN